jgi:hypothetical protein
MTRHPSFVKPLDNRPGKNGYPQSDYVNSPANRELHAMTVERFRLWREGELRRRIRDAVAAQTSAPRPTELL